MPNTELVTLIHNLQGRYYLHFISKTIHGQRQGVCLLTQLGSETGKRWDYTYLSFPGGSEVKSLSVNTGDRFYTRVGKIPGRRKWEPTLVFLPENPIDGGAWQPDPTKS